MPGHGPAGNRHLRRRDPLPKTEVTTISPTKATKKTTISRPKKTKGSGGMRRR